MGKDRPKSDLAPDHTSKLDRIISSLSPDLQETYHTLAYASRHHERLPFSSTQLMQFGQELNAALPKEKHRKLMGENLGILIRRCQQFEQ